MNVKCIETGKVYSSQVDAELDMRVCASSISLVLSGKRPHANGYHFERTDEPALKIKRRCRCGTWFMPKHPKQYCCCPECYSPPQIARMHVKLGDSVDTERPFEFETNMMIVSDSLRGKPLTDIADMTKRTIESVTAQYQHLIETGVFYEYAKLWRTD